MVYFEYRALDIVSSDGIYTMTIERRWKFGKRTLSSEKFSVFTSDKHPCSNTRWHNVVPTGTANVNRGSALIKFANRRLVEWINSGAKTYREFTIQEAHTNMCGMKK